MKILVENLVTNTFDFRLLTFNLQVEPAKLVYNPCFL